jgi:hypothetical protein
LEALEVCKERDDDQTLWIERFIRGISLDIVSLKNEAIRIEEEKIKKKKKKLLDLNSRQLKLIRHLKHNPKIKRKEYVKMMGVSTMTAYRDINELVDRNILECKGGGRSTHYVLKNEKESENQEEKPQNNVVKVISDPGLSNTQNLNQDSPYFQDENSKSVKGVDNDFNNNDPDDGSVPQAGDDFSGFM